MRAHLIVVLLVACSGDTSTMMGDAGDDDQGPPKVTIAPTVSMGNAHGCRVTADGALTCWGGNGAVGGLGDGTTEDRATPVRILPSNSFASVSVARPSTASPYAHTCAIRVDGALLCWGANIYGQVGDGTKEPRSTPVRVGAEKSWTQVAAGHTHTCALEADGSLYCFGDNHTGQLGIGMVSENSVEPVRVGGDTDWTAIVAGNNASCALKSNGSLWCWGDARLRETPLLSARAPIQIGSDLDWAAVFLGERNGCALKRDGRLLCWGGNTGTFPGDEPVEVDGQPDWASASSSGEHLCGVKTDGRLVCWGSENRTGALGNGTTAGIDLAPVTVGADTDWDHVSAGLRTTCAVKRNAEMWCWGSNEGGAAATGVDATKSVPTQVGTDTDWANVAAGGEYTCATKASGALWCFGDNQYSQVAAADNIDQIVPARVGLETDWTHVTAGRQLGCGLRGSRLWCWGRLSAFEKAVPYQPNNTDDFLGVVASDRHHVALRSDGVVFGWGANGRNQINDTSTPSYNLPVQMTTGAASIAAGGDFSCVRLSDDTLRCAGVNLFGQLGAGTVSEQNATLTTVAGDHTWSAIDSGIDHSCAIESSGALYCWGNDARGRLGLGPAAGIPSPLPMQVGTATDWTQVSAGGATGLVYGLGHTCGIRADGSLWCWGDNDFGQLGDGSRVDRDTPTRIGTDTDWAVVSAGGLHTCARKTTGTLWCWGRNQWGAVGDGTALYTSPVKSL